MEIREELQVRAARMDQMIAQYLPAEKFGFAGTLQAAVNYSVTAGGKRLRPILMEASFELFGGTGDAIHPFLAAIEFIHTYSLVHDDLPAMDNDEYRRGKKTTHAVYGEAMGILAGDALLNLAYETIAEALVREALSGGREKRLARAFACLSSRAGVRGMVGGQSVDVESGDTLLFDPLCGEKLAYIYETKTAALIEAALMIGAILAGAGEEDIGRMERAGRLLGTAFQIQDDILDVTGDQRVLGKPIGSDEKNHKATYVAIYGMEAAKREVLTRSREAVGILESVGGDNRFLRELFLYLIDRDK